MSTTTVGHFGFNHKTTSVLSCILGHSMAIIHVSFLWALLSGQYYLDTNTAWSFNSAGVKAAQNAVFAKIEPPRTQKIHPADTHLQATSLSSSRFYHDHCM